MIFPSARSGKPDPLLILLITMANCTVWAVDRPPEEILEAARVNPLGNPVRLEAHLRKDHDRTPFRIIVDGSVEYRFADSSLILEMNESSSQLTERRGGHTGTIAPARQDQLVKGTDISYEDLSLEFLYWKNPKWIGDEKIKGQRCDILELQSYGNSSQYGVVRIWISRTSGALMRMEGYNRQGQLIRRFEVRSARKIDGQWMLKQMRIESLNPDSGVVTSRTYLEILGKAES